MQIVVKGKNLQLTKALKDYAEKKLAAIKKYFDHIIEVDVTLSVKESRDQTKSKACEVTVWANGIVLRAAKASEDLYASIDIASDKIERQVKKYREKLRDVPRRQTNRADRQGTHSVLNFSGASVGDDGTVNAPEIVRSGSFSMKPMFSDEAAEQLEMLRQEFYVFSNAETHKINVIYKRSDGNFGLIEPEL